MGVSINTRFKEKVSWRWKNTIIDFSNFNDGDQFSWDERRKSWCYKINMIMQFLPCPVNKDIHEWENGQYSSEYNEALRAAFELDLVEQMWYVESLDCYLDEEQYQCFEYYKLSKEEEKTEVKDNV